MFYGFCIVHKAYGKKYYITGMQITPGNITHMFTANKELSYLFETKEIAIKLREHLISLKKPGLMREIELSTVEEFKKD